MKHLKDEAEETGEKISHYLFSHLKALEKEAKKEIQKFQLRADIKHKVTRLVEEHEDELLRKKRNLDDFKDELNRTHKLCDQGFQGEARRAMTKKFGKSLFRSNQRIEDLEHVSRTFKIR